MLSNLEIIGWKKFRGQPKLDEAAGRVQFGCQRNFWNPIISKLDKHVVLLLINYIPSQLLAIAQSERILHGGEKIWISCSSGKNYIARVNATREHKINIFELMCNVNVLMMPFLTIFRRFPTTFRRFSKFVPKARRTFPNIFRRLTKIAEDDRRRSKDVSIVHQQILV